MSRKYRSLARVYSKAFVATQGHDGIQQTEWEKIESSLTTLARLIRDHKSLKVSLLSPVTSFKEKSAIIDQLAKKIDLPQSVQKFLHLIIQKGRAEMLDSLLPALEEVQVESKGGVVGEVVSAQAVQKRDLDSLAEAFSKKLGKKVEFRVTTDPELLSGLKVTVNGVTYDGTLRSQLDQIKDLFVRGN